MIRALPLLVALCFAWTAQAEIPDGRGRQTATIDWTEFEVYTWKPDGCAISGILLVFHGLGRNVAGYRDYAIPLGRAYCRVVVAPEFDVQRFPTWRYQHGGIAHGGAVQPEASWTVNDVPRFADWARQQLGQPNLEYAVIGHSAGAQFISRFAAFRPNDATRIVVVNPSTWVRPTLDDAAPYGFGGVYPPSRAETELKRYLAEPIVVLLGEEDVEAKDLAMQKEAVAQGATRLERGRNVFAQARDVAAAHHWPFGWTMATVPGIGHSARSMFASDQALRALRP